MTAITAGVTITSAARTSIDLGVGRSSHGHPSYQDRAAGVGAAVTRAAPPCHEGVRWASRVFRLTGAFRA
jgi:hypothetical protein